MINKKKLLLSVEYVSATDSLLNTSKGQDIQQDSQHPIYLLHTLCHNEDEYTQKIRNMEIIQRMYVFERIKDQGNKHFNKQDYENCIKMYERALGCFKWLEIKEEVNIDEEQEDENQNKNSEEYKEQKRIKLIYEQKQKKFEKDFKLFLMNINQLTTKIVEYYKCENQQEIDTCKALTHQIYINLSVVYMKCGFFKLGMQAIKDAESIRYNSSILQFRKAQCICYDLESSLEQLEEAEMIINQSIHMKKHEKIFQAQPGLLELLGYENSDEIFINLAKQIQQRKKERINYEYDIVSYIMNKVKETEIFEQQLVEKGLMSIEEVEKRQQEELVKEEDEDNLEEYEVVQILEKKYYQMIQYYKESNQNQQSNDGYQELQNVKAVLNKINYILNIKFEQYKHNTIVINLLKTIQLDMDSQLIQKRCYKQSIIFIKSIFDSANFEFNMIKFAIDEYFDKTKNKKKNKTEQEKNAYNKKHIFNTLPNQFICLQISLFMLLIFVLLYYKYDSMSKIFNQYNLERQK